MLIGSLEAAVEEAQTIPDDLPSVLNDLDIPEDKIVAIKDRSEYLLKVTHLCKNIYYCQVLNKGFILCFSMIHFKTINKGSLTSY